MKNLKKCIALVLIFALGMMGMAAYAAPSDFSVRLEFISSKVMKSGYKAATNHEGTLVHITECGDDGYTTVVVRLYRNGSAVSASQQVVLNKKATVSPNESLYKGDYMTLYGRMAAVVIPGLSVQVSGEIDFQ